MNKMMKKTTIIEKKKNLEKKGINTDVLIKSIEKKEKETITKNEND